MVPDEEKIGMLRGVISGSPSLQMWSSETCTRTLSKMRNSPIQSEKIAGFAACSTHKAALVNAAEAFQYLPHRH
jgi:hypothetical protein